MKKSLFLLGLISFVLAFVVTGCEYSNTTTAFKKAAKKYDFTYKNVTKDYSSDERVKVAYVATSDDGVTVEYFLLDSEESAREIYNLKVEESDNIEGTKEYKSTESPIAQFNDDNHYTYLTDKAFAEVHIPNKNVVIYETGPDYGNRQPERAKANYVYNEYCKYMREHGVVTYRIGSKKRD